VTIQGKGSEICDEDEDFNKLADKKMSPERIAVANVPE